MDQTSDTERETPSHLEGISDGGGCVEAWEAISEALEEDSDDEDGL